MGNRAVITTKDKELAIYVHWNGGRDSIQGFLTYCKLKEHRPPEQDSYGWARLTQVIANFFGGSLCIGVQTYASSHKDNYDNGVYIIENWEIVGREFPPETEQTEYKLLDMIMSINDKQPKQEQLTEMEILEKLNQLKINLNNNNEAIKHGN